MIRYVLLVSGVCAATVAGCSAIWGVWAAAAGWGTVAVLHLVGAAVLELRHRRHEREQWLRERAAVWTRRDAEQRDHYTIDSLFQEYQRFWAERGPVATTVVYDNDGEPVAAYNSRGRSAAVWPSDSGAPE